MSNPIADLIEDLTVQLQAVQGVQNVLQVYSDADLRQVVANVTGLSVGVVYDGMKGTQAEGSKRTGLSAEVQVSLLICMPQMVLGSPVPKSYSLEMLDNLRNVVRNTQSTTGHYWRFVAEAPAMEKEGTVVWMQRWVVPIQLTQNM